MKRRAGFTLVELFVVLVVVGILAALIVPTVVRGARNARIVRCADNLATLWKALEAARVSPTPTEKVPFPRETGGALWIRLSAARPEGARLLDCPVRAGTPASGACDYRGPKEDLNTAVLKSDDPIGADLEGNHGEKVGGNLLRQSGDVLNVQPEESGWERAKVKLAP